MKVLYNPLNEDFSIKYDVNGDMNPETFTAPAMTISYFEDAIWEHIRKHLIDHILNVRELNPTIPKNTEDIIKEIDVEL